MLEFEDHLLNLEYCYFNDLTDTLEFLFSEVEDRESYDKKLKLFNSVERRNSKSLLVIQEILNRQLKNYELKKI